MDQGTSSHYNAYHEQTVMKTIESNDETVIGGLSQGDDAAKLRALYPTEKGESPVYDRHNVLDLHVNSGILVNGEILIVNTDTPNQTDSLFEHIRNHSGNGRGNKALILDVKHRTVL